MKDQIKHAKVMYIIFAILDFGLTFGGSAGIIVMNYLHENSVSYKMTLSGIILTIMLFFTAKSIYEKSYQRNLDNLLQDLASATDVNVKTEINKKIDSLKLKRNIYDRLMVIMPFAIVYIITWLGEKNLAELNSTCGLILTTLSAGSVFNILKKPQYEKYRKGKIEYKVQKKYE
jgi:hypothetical protein